MIQKEFDLSPLYSFESLKGKWKKWLRNNQITLIYMNSNKNEEKEQSIRPDMYLGGKIWYSCLIDYLNYEKKSSRSINIFHLLWIKKLSISIPKLETVFLTEKCMNGELMLYACKKVGSDKCFNRGGSEQDQ